MNKIVFFDTETTGIDLKVHGIHQLAGEVVFNGEVIETFDYRIKPFKGCKIDSKALEISRTSKFDLSKYQPEENALSDFQRMMRNCIATHLNDKIFLAGWRVPEFDNKFLQALFERHNAMTDFKSFFWSNPIDVKTLATQHLIDKRTEMESFSLVSVAKYLGIEVDESKLHSAAYDAYLSRIIYNIVKG